MERLSGLLSWALRVMARLLPPERRDWAEAVQAHLADRGAGGRDIGVAPGWVEGQGALREARIRQGLLAGAVVGACCGLLVINLAMMLFLALILGPPAGLVGGALGGAFADQHPLKRRAGSRAAGLFVSSS
jgi:hypothetical protein